MRLRRASIEIDLKDHDALILADRIATFKFVTPKVALDHRLYATFMPKPIFALSGSGMHVHQSLYRGQENAFYEPRAEGELSETAVTTSPDCWPMRAPTVPSPTRSSTPSNAS